MRLHELFGVLSSEVKLKILSLLLDGERCVCQIYASVGTSQPNVSQHLNVLRHLGIVNYRRDGTFIYYSLNEGLLKEYPFLLEILKRAREEYRIEIEQTCAIKK